MNTWLDEWMDGWMNGWMDGWMDGWSAKAKGPTTTLGNITI